MAESTKQAAIDYTELGLRVTPLDGKIPISKHGFNDFTDEPDDVRENWNNPRWNVGVKMGDGIISIDVDRDDTKGYDGNEHILAWEREHGSLPETASFITGRGGYQLLYKVDREVRGHVNENLHIDIRGDGSGAVFPPSLHPNGNRYEWENHPDDVPIADADDNVYALLEYINEKPLGEYEKFEMPDEVFEGDGRNNKLYKQGASWQALEWDDEAIVYGLRYINEHNFIPPLDDDERDKAINSVLQLPKGKSEKFSTEHVDINDEIGHIDLDAIPELKPALLDGVVRKGGVLMLGGASKAGKTFMLIQLALALSMGRNWMGKKCEECSVLYINLEVDKAEFANRYSGVFRKLYFGEEAKRKTHEKIGVMNLRGKIQGMKDLVDKLTEELHQDVDVVIVDPSYKVIEGDENLARDVHEFTNQLDRLANGLDASVIYCHHHSKGFKGDTGRMDRTSGSGVFARHADALIDCIELEVDENKREELGIGDKPCFRLQFTTRSFKRPDDVDVVFDYPIHKVFENGELSDCEPLTPARSGSKKGHETQKSKAQSNADRTIEYATQQIMKFGKVKVTEVAKELNIDKKTVIAHIEKSEFLVWSYDPDLRANIILLQG